MKNKETKRKKKTYPRLSRRTDVVVTGQSHYENYCSTFTVVLRYEREKDDAPRVLIKTENEEALSLLKVAKKTRLYIENQVALARTLCGYGNEGEIIPPIYHRSVGMIYEHRLLNDKSNMDCIFQKILYYDKTTHNKSDNFLYSLVLRCLLHIRYGKQSLD